MVGISIVLVYFDRFNDMILPVYASLWGFEQKTDGWDGWMDGYRGI